jgi:uncharacterized coiled-coil protein SlyX
LAEAENTAENLSTALAELSVKIGKTIKRVSILTGQLKKTSLSLVIAREKEAIIALKNECTIYYLITPRTRNNTTQTIKITC